MADNYVAGTVAVASKEIAGKHATTMTMVDWVGADVLGLVTANPAATSILGRLKSIADGVTTLAGHVDGLEGFATSLNGFVDGLEALIGTTNTSLTGLSALVDGLEGLQGTANTTLTSLAGYTDNLEALQGTANTTLAAISGFVDGIEALLTTLNGYVDGLETVGANTITAVNKLGSPDYETVAASATATLGVSGAAGDRMVGVLIVPASLSPGAVSIKDGSGGATIPLFAGGANSITTLHPFFVPFEATAANDWRLTTGANVSAVAFGDFT